ncbi:MAG TPA: sugar transferase [Bryobacteraceae bacterium]|nr:sugar transferase [Bryobacteraceae bacterium]
MVRVFRVSVPTSIFVLIVSELLILTCCYCLATYWLLQVDPLIFLLDEGGLGRILLVCGSIILGLHFLDLYSEFQTVSKIGLLLEIAQAIGFAFLVQAFIAYLNQNWVIPRWVMITGSGMALVALGAWRVLYDAVFLAQVGLQRILFLGRNAVVRDIAEYLPQHPEIGWLNLGYLDDASQPGEMLHAAPVLGGVKDLRRIAEEASPDRIIIGMTERRDRMPVQDLLDLRFSGIMIEEAGAAYETVCGRICTKELRPSQLIFSGELGPRPANLALQTCYSFPLALFGFIIALPVMILAAVAVRLTSKGPALFRQVRVGLSGKPFTLYKFRSMRLDAEAGTGAVWATKDDPRITMVGKWIRKLRVDELPQLWNVLRGDMSIVGPRPERPEFVRILSEKIPYYPQRHSVKPGITGWAQINHKYGDTIEETVTKLEYDLYYIKHMCMSLDLYVMFHTVKTMLRQRGAQ